LALSKNILDKDKLEKILDIRAMTIDPADKKENS